MSNILILTAPRTCSTAISRSFAQGKSLLNEPSIHFYCECGGHFHSSANPKCITQPRNFETLLTKLQTTSNNVIHEMAGDLSLEQMERLATVCTVIIITRSPYSQYKSLQKLNVPEDMLKNILTVGWTNLLAYKRYATHILRAEDILRSPDTYGISTLLPDHLGPDFHKTCTITSGWENAEKNPWNGPSGSATELRPDPSENLCPSPDELLPSEYFIALQAYNQLHSQN